MTTDRRTFLKASAAALAGTALANTVSAESTWSYELVTEALDPKVAEVDVQGDWAYTATLDSITTVDLSDPQTALVGGTALGHGQDNFDAKVEGNLAGLANDGDPQGVTFYDVSDPATPVEVSFYETASGIHNHFLDGDHAYLCVNESGEADFSRARMEVVDVSDPSNPAHAGSWGLYEHHPDMAMAGINPIHDIWVQDDFAYMCWWDAGVVVADVSDKSDPTAVAHFGAADHADDTSMSEAEATRQYLGGEKTNAHYVQPTPDGNYTFVGAETFPGPFEDVVVPGDHGGIRVFDTSGVTRDSTPSNPTESHDAYIPAPQPVDDILTTSHNFDVLEDKLFTSWYQGGIRAFDIEDPLDPREIAAFAPEGTAYWGARNLPTDGPKHYTVGGDIGKGVTVLELDHDTPGEQNWESDEELGPLDVLEPTMQEPL